MNGNIYAMCAADLPRHRTSCSSDANTLHIICSFSNANDIMWPLLTAFSPLLTTFGSSANNLAMAINVTALVVYIALADS
jgi:hypothetical protein